MSRSKKIIIGILLALMLIVATAFTTYRVIIHNISIGVSEDTARVTVFGQSDDYDYDFVDMNPTHQAK